MDQAKIGRFIAEMRRRQGLTQRQFAELLGISDKSVSKWECGNGMPDISLMPPICGALKISLNELFSGELLSDADYRKSAEENLLMLIRKAGSVKKNIVGGDVLGQSETVVMEPDVAQQTNAGFWETAGGGVLGPIALPAWGTFLPSEDTLGLLGDLSGKRVLEIACGDGRSLEYAARHGAAELWGLDISSGQIARAKAYLAARGVNAHLVRAPMEEARALPADRFDVVYSVYGIGWSTDLDATFSAIHAYLKAGGIFVFAWSHPIHKCVSIEDGRLVFSNSYFNEEWYRAELGGREIMLSNRMLSTYINALARNGFRIERLVEETDREKAAASDSDFGRKALMLPTAFAVRAVKA